MGNPRNVRNRRRFLYRRASEGGEPRCTYCGTRVGRNAEAFAAKPEDEVQFFTQDHVIPKGHGGTNHRHNLAAACAPCNIARGTKPLDEFIESLGERAVITAEQARSMMVRGRIASGFAPFPWEKK